MRVSRSNASGQFTIKGVANGKYRAYALNDVDGDLVFGQKSEIIAFSRDSIIPSWKPDTRQDTIWRDSLHIANIVPVPYTHFLPDDVTLVAFQEPQTDRYMLKTERTSPEKLGVFFSYGIVYDRLLDRSRSHKPVWYMILHVFLILSLGFTTNALEFMREPEVDSMKKALMLILSLLVFFVCLALTAGWSNREQRHPLQIYGPLFLEFAVTGVLIFLLIGSSQITILLTVLLIYAQLLTLYLADKQIEKRQE